MTNELGINDINIVSLRVYLEDPSRNLSRHLRTLASIWKYAVLYGIGGGGVQKHLRALKSKNFEVITSE